MMMYDLDPDGFQLGLHLIKISRTNNVSSGIVTLYEKDTSLVESVNEGFYDSVVENDEVIAQTLQEELSRLEVAEASGSEVVGEKHNEMSILAQHWLGPPGGNIKSELSVEAIDQEILPEIENESVLDCEVGRRLNQMIPVPHVPKINGEIPSSDEATSDHQRLLHRLRLYDLDELKISGDGNCQFRSLSDQIYRTPEHHEFVREQVINQLKSRPDLYENYVPMAYSDYLKKMSKSGEWGDNITLQAVADSYGVKILVITSFKDTCYIEILPRIQKSNRIIFLSFWAEVHYNSIYPLGDLPVVESKKEEWWT